MFFKLVYAHLLEDSWAEKHKAKDKEHIYLEQSVTKFKEKKKKKKAKLLNQMV